MHFNLTIATPTGAGDTTLFDSTVNFGGARVVPLMGIKRMVFAFKNDQIGTLKAYRSTDGGSTWDQYDSQAVTIPAATAISGPYDYLIDPYLDVKWVWTNTITQTVWRVDIEGIEHYRVSGT